ncbi:hypothetical protein MUN89_12130 [Halobacillus salinarum]|uniref:Uncharacterized protein n=1 Tax=Halobacillus salinarum TaxID=2932257 RepID=A0ABY4EF81_9BACI|nr:hypothetical protein [Halobacillus salinarum]UOQ42718.1 hypothetical protein MUN89_12130 [Halobacillus salinarum]
MGAYCFSTFLEEEDQCKIGELTVNKDRFVREVIGQAKVGKMNSEGFFVSPGHVMIDFNSPVWCSSSIQDTCEHYIQRGCTLLLLQHPVSSIRRFRADYAAFLEQLPKLPVDFMIVPVIPSAFVKPDMVRFFAKEGCPFIQIELDSAEDVQDVPWGWLTQAQSYKRIPLTVTLRSEENSTYLLNYLWPEICKQYGIIKLSDIQEAELLTKQNLRDTGIYPNKGGFRPGGYADYNLYWQPENKIFDGEDPFIYHNAIPDVTIMRGKVIQVQQQVEPTASGEYQRITVYQHFV